MKLNNNSSTNKEVNTIINIFDEKIKKIMAIEYHYNLFELFKVIDEKSEQEQNDTYEKLINHYLNLIKENGNYQTILDKNRDIEDVLEFFDFAHFLDKEEEKNTCYEMQTEGDYVVCDLIAKVFRKNERFIELPIKLQTIKDFSIPNTVPKSEMKYVILYIILRLAVVYYFSISEK